LLAQIPHLRFDPCAQFGRDYFNCSSEGVTGMSAPIDAGWRR
jgi:hypothetical protein